MSLALYTRHVPWTAPYTLAKASVDPATPMMERTREAIRNAVADAKGKHRLRYCVTAPHVYGIIANCLDDLGVEYEFYPTDADGNRAEWQGCVEVALVVKDA